MDKGHFVHYKVTGCGPLATRPEVEEETPGETKGFYMGDKNVPFRKSIDLTYEAMKLLCLSVGPFFLGLTGLVVYSSIHKQRILIFL